MTPKIARFLAAASAGDAVPGAGHRPRGREFPRASRCPAAGADLLRRQSQSGASGAGAAGAAWPAPSMPPVSRKLTPASTPARAPRRSALAIPSKRCRRSVARMQLGVTLFAFDSERSWRSWRRMHRARGFIAACWSRTKAPTGRCRANSAPRSRTRGN